ncbi:SurA N-terminal domain-containing protein [Marivibrio halodurans]|uniref:Parvulin-like PPIase n=1 Tax=Marivibrio halodurans TaxID=2039722 RepID=A0A8J7RYS1_9PROT|nr:SurA N-terminal domain-containing protein [Marivibrio halodurans]MBP5855479.1 SurA N-terminal domain-containing protein [Marivibrio halodurans]
MLQAMRTGVASWVAKGILAIVVLSFAGWGVQDYMNASGPGGGGNVAAEVGDQQIGINELSQAYRTELRRNNLQSVDSETARQLGLARRTLDGMVTRALFDAEASALGLTATDAMVRQDIQSTDQFRNQFGSFDRELFQNTLAAAGITEQSYVAGVRNDLSRQQLLSAAAAGTSASPALVDALFQYHGARLSAVSATVPLPDAASVPAPDEGDLQAFYDANKDSFQLPEFRRLSYIHLAPQDLIEEVAVPEEEIQATYEARRDTYTRPERRALQQLLLPDEETAQRAAAMIEEGRTIESVAEEIAGVDPAGLDLGTFTQGEIPDETLAETAFALPEGGVSEPVQGAFGWFLVKVTSVEQGAVTPLAQVRDEIRNDLALDEAIDAVYDLSKRIDEAFGEGLTLEETAERVALPVKTVDAVSRQGRDPAGEPVEGLPPGVSFLETAWNTPAGEASFLEETANNGYFVLRVDEVMAPRVPPLSEITERVEDAWREDRRDALAEERAEVLADAARNGGSLRQAAEAEGHALTEIDGFGRDGGGDQGNLPRALATALFDLEVGGIDYAADPEGGYVVAEVTGRTPASEAADASLRENIAQSLAAGLQGEIVDELAAALRTRFDVTVNEGVVDRVY